MPIIKSAKKRVKLTAKASARNTRTKREMRDSLKAFAKAIEGGKAAEITKAHSSVMSAIDVAAKKSIIHKNKAARIKSRLSQEAKDKGAKPGKSTPKKAAVSKKSPAKKPASRNLTAKKSAAKKSS
jgi:small subunit ribosomal protein S20